MKQGSFERIGEEREWYAISRERGEHKIWKT